MLLPLYDSNPKHRIPFQYVTVAIIASCFLVFLWQQVLGAEDGARAVYGLGVIPVVLFGNRDLPPELLMVPTYMTLVTSIFLHGGWMHLIGNMIFLWVLGDNVEDAMGHTRFVAFYLICGLAAAFTHAVLDPQSTVPMIGASGAISGVIGAYLLLHPRASIHVLVGFFVVGLPAWIVLGFWIGLQVLKVTTGGGAQIAWWAHIGGAIAGGVLISFFKHRDVALFNDVTANPTSTAARPRPKGIRIARAVRKSPNSRKGPWGQ
jgi:membrane associated rhomboid family serine protease